MKIFTSLTFLRLKSKRLPHSIASRFAPLFIAIKAWMLTYVERFKILDLIAWAKLFTPSQWCYFIAAILLVSHFLFDSDNLKWVAIIAFAGLVRELFKIFHRVWSMTIGKSFIIITYASTANLALAFAAVKINVITGIEPTPFIFTLGFTTLMLMPFWVALSSLIIFLFVLIVANLWLLLSLLLKLVGMKIQIHWEDKKRAFLTMVLRVVLIPIVLAHLISVMLPFFNNDISEQFVGGDLNFSIGEQGSAFYISSEPSTGYMNNETDTNDDIESFSEEELKQQQEFVSNIQSTQLFIEKVIAGFIYNFEAYPNSACLKRDEQKSVIIDDFSVLLISRNADAKHGYDYEVTKCIPRYNEPQAVPAQAQ